MSYELEDSELENVSGGYLDKPSEIEMHALLMRDMQGPIELGNGSVGCTNCCTSEGPVVLDNNDIRTVVASNTSIRGVVYKCCSCNKVYVKERSSGTWYSAYLM